MGRAAELSVDLLVVGGGVVGASIAYHLAASGAGTVALCEQGRVPGGGATARSAGLLRLHHTSHCQTRLAARSLPVFQQWPELIGGDCGYRPVGFLMLVAPAQEANLVANDEAVRLGGGESQLLTGDELAARFPQLDPAGVAAAAYEPAGGYADPARAAGTLVEAARRCGARIHEGARVAGLVTAGDRVVGVDTNLGRIATGTVVLAAGGWAARLAGPAGVDLPVTARRIGLARTGPPAPTPGQPPTPACIDDTIGCYFRSDGDGIYFGVVSHPSVQLGREVDPLSPVELATARSTIATRIPAMRERPITGTRVGLDGYTPDRHPIIGPAGPDGLYAAAGFSGGGFKLAPAVGELAAAEIVEATPQPLLDPYRPDRFAAGKPLELDFPYAYS